MSQIPMSERLKFLMSALGLKVGPFARTMGVSDTNVRNYLDRGSKPSSEFLENLIRNFDTINPSWLLTGEGEPFLPGSPQSTINTAHIQNNSGIGINTGTVTLEACQRELEAVKRDAASYQREIELLKGQLEDKNEIIILLRGGYNRSN